MNARPLIPILILSVLTVAGSPTALRADQLLRRLPWDPLDAADGEGVRLVDDERYGPVLELASDRAAGRSVTVLEIHEPGIADRRYAILGKVRYDDVEGRGHLEMWSVFPDGSRHFSKTLGRGPIRPLSGSAGWRTFVLPFDLLDAPQKPSALTLGLVLPGRGTVWLHGLELRQYAADEDPVAAVSGAWWGDRQAALIGGFGGAALGTLAGLFQWLAGRGRARATVLVGVASLIAIAVASLVVGIVALAIGQPYPVYYPLLLLGGLGVLIMPGRLRAMRQRYTELELRRMQRRDLGAA